MLVKRMQCKKIFYSILYVNMDNNANIHVYIYISACIHYISKYLYLYKEIFTNFTNNHIIFVIYILYKIASILD